jgi:hypothetical protein
LTINSSNIDTVLALDNSHSWKDGSGNISSAVWSTTTYANDILTITLSDVTSAPSVDAGDIITLDGTIKDALGRSINESIEVTGTFGVSSMPSGAIAYYKFDEGGGSTLNDEGNNYNGTVTGATWVTGRSGGGADKALSYSSGQYVTLESDIPLGTEWTVEAWAKTPLATVFNPYKHAIVAQSYDLAHIMIYDLTTNTEIAMWCFNKPGCSSPWLYKSGVTVSSLSDGWHHFVTVGHSGGQDFYIDGIKTSNSSSLRIPYDIKYIGHSWGNAIDEVVIYDRQLTLGEIQDRFNNPPEY